MVKNTKRRRNKQNNYKSKTKGILSTTIAGAVLLAAAANTYYDDIIKWLDTNNAPITKEVVTCKITSVHDGDSMRVRCPGHKNTIPIRLEQIDAPETDQAYGLKSRDYLRGLCVRGKQAKIHKSDIDMYDRVIARVYCNGIDVNAEMVKTGNAWVYEYYATDKSLFALQKKAQQQKLGLWNSQKKVVAPWDFRYQQKKAKDQ